MKNIILVIFTTVLLYNCSTEDNYKIDIPKIGKTEPKSFIAPPFGTCIEFITLTINPNKDTLIQFESGSFLEIPKGCFVDKQGKDLNSSTKIKFREFDSNEDIFLSGIPMTYKDESGDHFFESAGMCEIKPIDDIQFAKGKEIKVGLNSQSSETDFGLYSFNEKTGKWETKGKDSVMVSLKIIQKDNQPTPIKALQKIDPAPVKPNKLDPNDPRLITLKLDNDQYVPELKKYENVMFHVSEKSKYKRGESKKAWYYVEVKNTNTKGLYKLKFYGKSDTGEDINLEYFVEPALEGKDYETAINEYEELFKEHEKDMKLIQDANEKQEAETQKMLEIAKNYEKNADNIDKSSAGIQRVFTSDNFGIFNCDRFYILTDFTELFFKYQNKTNDEISFYELYCIDNKTRAVVPVGFPDKIKFPKDNHHSFWGVTMKGELAIIDNFKLTKQNLEGNLVEMKFSTQDVTKSSPEDISQKIRASF